MYLYDLCVYLTVHLTKQKAKLARYTGRNNNSGLSRTAAPALITERTSMREVCCLSPLHIFNFKNNQMLI